MNGIQTDIYVHTYQKSFIKLNFWNKQCIEHDKY